MNRFTIILLIAVALVAPASAYDTVIKTALLVVPAADMRSRIVEFRWDEDESLRINVSPERADFCTRGNMRIYSDDDRLVPATSITISDPTVGPTRIVKRGELVRLYLDYQEVHVLPRSGDYYEVASFDGWSGEKRVLFVTKRHWFTFNKT